MDITISNIYKSFGDIRVFEGFSRTLRSGSIYLLTSGSGTGKTTLLRMLMGLETPDSGHISGIPDSISAVFQEDRLIEGLSVTDNIALVCPDTVKKEDIIRELDMLRLGSCAFMPVNELSGGMSRRAALVRAVMHPGELLLLDEPFTGLDSDLIDLCTDYLLKRAAGRTCVIASHIRNERLEEISETILF